MARQGPAAMYRKPRLSESQPRVILPLRLAGASCNRRVSSSTLARSLLRVVPEELSSAPE